MSEFTITPALPPDVPEIAALFRRVRLRDLAFLPVLHTPEEDLGFFTDVVFRECTVLKAVAAQDAAGETGGLLGFIAVKPGWVEHLYVDGPAQGRGIGAALLGRALRGRALNDAGLGAEIRLWTFQKNLRARRFYAAHGFIEERLTDGSGNEEREPDVLMLRRR